MSVSYGGDKITFDDGTSIASGFTHFRNRVFNGSMEIDQRNAGASVSLDNSRKFIVDRFSATKDTSSATVVCQQSTEAPPNYINSLLCTVSTGASPSASNDNVLGYFIEGRDISDWGWGTASAKTITISFWVRSSIVGNYGLSLSNSAADRAYMARYTVNNTNTWEYKTVTIPGDTTGTWLTTSGIGLRIWWDMGSGSSRSVSASTSWSSSYGTGLTGGVKLVSTTNATFYLTGVQVELGSYATTFEHRPYGTELALCQRYLPAYRHNGQDILPSQIQFNASTTSRGFISFPVPTRVPVTGMTISSAGHFTIFGFAGGNGTASAFTMHAGGTMGAGIDVSSGTSFTTRDCGTLGITNSSGFVYFTGAEL